MKSGKLPLSYTGFTTTKPTSGNVKFQDEPADLTADWREQELEEEAAFRSLFVKDAGDDMLSSFFKWLCTKGWWEMFWAEFRSDGLMSWHEFEKFVHYDGKWVGDKRGVFKEMAKHCSGGDADHPCLTASGVLDLKRWWEDLKDPGKYTSQDNFKWIFGEHYGNLGCAWRWALDTDDTGTCCFLVFCRCCQELGLRKNLKTIWEQLTGGNIHRSIFFRDWDPVGDRVLSRFAMALSIQYGNMRDGLHRCIRNAGGHMHKAAFIDCCEPLGLDMHEASWLFTVLDTKKVRFLTEFDRLRFLSHWDPGNVSNMTIQDLKMSSHVPKKKMVAKIKAGQNCGTKNSEADMPFDVSHKNPFGFKIELNEEEHKEYQRRLKVRGMTTGKDGEAVEARILREAKTLEQSRKDQMVKDLLQRPLVTRDFNDREMLMNPDIAKHAQA